LLRKQQKNFRGLLFSAAPCRSIHSAGLRTTGFTAAAAAAAAALPLLIIRHVAFCKVKRAKTAQYSVK